jgi:serine/threonine protein phosphatase PrpC
MKKTSNLVFKISGDSEKGIRPKNEDNFYCGVNQAGQLLAIIADGIGSLENSEIVSKSVVQNYEKQFQKYMSISDPTEFFSSTNEII